MSFEDETLLMYVVYRHHKGHWIVCAQRGGKPGLECPERWKEIEPGSYRRDGIAFGSTSEAAVEEWIAEMGLVKMMPMEGDDPSIVAVWI